MVHVADLHADPEYALPEVLKSQIRTALGVPLLGDGEPVGVINLTRLLLSPSPRGGRWAATSADSQLRFFWAFGICAPKNFFYFLLKTDCFSPCKTIQVRERISIAFGSHVQFGSNASVS